MKVCPLVRNEFLRSTCSGRHSNVVCSASIAHFVPTVSVVFTNTPRNVGHILAGQLGQCFCSPLSDPLGQHGALTQRYQGRERPAVSLSPFLRVGQE